MALVDSNAFTHLQKRCINDGDRNGKNGTLHLNSNQSTIANIFNTWVVGGGLDWFKGFRDAPEKNSISK